MNAMGRLAKVVGLALSNSDERIAERIAGLAS
jgi:hypothetical protein